jgi:hypothetical protein
MVVGTNFEKIVGLILGQSFAPGLMDRPNRLWPMQRAVHPNMVRAVPKRRQTFAWDRVAEIAKTFEVVNLKMKPHSTKTSLDVLIRTSLRVCETFFHDFTT